MGLLDWLYEDNPDQFVEGSIPDNEEMPEDAYQKFLKGLNSTVGTLVGAAKKPIDWLASHEVGPDILSTNPNAITAALMREDARPVETKPAEELLTNALFPERLPGDQVNVAPTFSRMGPVTQPRPATEEEKVVDEAARRILRKGTTTVGGLALNPITPVLGLPGAAGKVVAGAFIPGMAESLGEQGGKAISAYESGDIPGMTENLFGAGLDALFLGGMAKHIGSREAPISSESKQSEVVNEPNLERAAPKDISEPITNPEDLVSTPHEQQAREAFSQYIDDIKAEVARVTGQEHIANASVEYVPGLTDRVRYNPETNTVQMDPALLFKDRADVLADTAFHELAHGGENARHQFGDIEYTGNMVPGPKGYPVAEAINKIEIGKLPPEEGLPTPDTYEIDAGELGLTPKQLDEAGNYVITDPSLHEHYTPNIEARAASFAPNEVSFRDAYEAAKNNPATIERGQRFAQDIAGIQKAAREAELAKKGLKPALSYEDALKEIQSYEDVTGETGAPKSADIERQALEQYAKEQDTKVKLASERFQTAKTESERSIASKEFQSAKAERDRVQARITQLGGKKVIAETPKPKVEAKPTKSEKVEETPPSERVVSSAANNLRRLLEGTDLTRFNINNLPEALKAKGLDVPPELKAQLPELIKELKDRGWVNEKIGGTYTLLTAPPKQLKAVSGGKIADVTNLRGSLEESLKALGQEPVTTKAPTPTSNVRPGQFHFDETGRKWEIRRVEGDQVTLTSGRGGGERTQVLSKDDILARRGVMPGKETAMAEEPPTPEDINIDLSSLDVEKSIKDTISEDVKEFQNDIPGLIYHVRNTLQEAGKEGTPEYLAAVERDLGLKSGRLNELIGFTPEVKVPDLSAKMKEKLTPDEIQAIAKLFGTEKKRKGTSETPQEVLDAQKAALRGLVEREKKGGEGLPPTEEIPEGGPKQSFDVTLNDGTTHKVRASSPEEAQTLAEEVLTRYNSTKKVDKVEPTLTSLEKAAKYEIEPVREASESISEQVTEGKAEQKAQAKRTGEQLKYQEQLRKAQVSETKKLQKTEDKELTQLAKKEAAIRRAQTKEKFAEKPFTVSLSNGRVVTIRARNEKVAREIVESAIKRNKSTVTVQGTAAKPSALDEAITGAARKVEETGFLQNPVVKVLNAVKSITFGGDVGHLLRQGKQMNADLLFSKHAKKVLDQLPVLWKLGKGGMKELESLNEKIYSDPDIKMMVDNFGMDMPGMGKGLKEEAFHGAGLAENLPVVGKHYVERSEAVYTGGLNYLRAAEAKKWIENLKKDGFTPDNAPEKYHAVARAINIISQRGSFSPAYQKLFSDASAIYGAPRAKAARLQNAFELFRGGTSGRITRTTAAKTLAFNAGLYGLLAATTGAKFITDPEASDFGKIRVNDKITVDPWMGLGVTARTVAKLMTGKGKSPYTGKDYPVTPSDALMTEFLGGIAPGVKLVWEAMSGKDLRGYQVDRLESLLNVTPLTAKSIQELFKEGDVDEAIELSILQFAGEGVDVFNYEESKAKQARLRAERGLSTGRSGRKKKRTYAFD